MGGKAQGPEQRETSGVENEVTLEDAIQGCLVPEGGVLTRFVLIAEFDNGHERELLGCVSDNIVDWDRDALINAAADPDFWKGELE